MATFTAIPPRTVTYAQNMAPQDASFVADEPYALDDNDITILEPNSGIRPIFEVSFGNLGLIEGQMQIEYVFVDFVNAGATIELWESGVKKATSPENHNGQVTSVNSAFFNADLLTDKSGSNMRIRFVGGLINGTDTINSLKAIRLLAYVDLPIGQDPDPDPSEIPFIDAKTNWTPDDYYDHTALNRVENMLTLLKTKVEAYRKTTFTLHMPNFGRTQDHIPFAEELYFIERDTAILGDALNNPAGFISPKMGWSYNSPFTFEDANRLENNLVVLNRLITLQLNSRRYCGQYIVGDEGVS